MAYHPLSESLRDIFPEDERVTYKFAFCPYTKMPKMNIYKDGLFMIAFLLEPDEEKAVLEWANKIKGTANG